MDVLVDLRDALAKLAMVNPLNLRVAIVLMFCSHLVTRAHQWWWNIVPIGQQPNTEDYAK